MIEYLKTIVNFLIIFVCVSYSDGGVIKNIQSSFPADLSADNPDLMEL